MYENTNFYFSELDWQPGGWFICVTLQGKTSRLGSSNQSTGGHQPRISIIIHFTKKKELTEEKWFSRFSTFATRCTTMTEDWTGWTSTASSAEKVGGGLYARLVSSQCPHISVCHSKAPISPSGTVFDQQTLTCNFPEDAFPCEESPSLYGQVRRAEWSKYFRL